MHDVPHIVKNLWASVVKGNLIKLSYAVVDEFDLPSNEVSVTPVRELLAFHKDKDLKIAPKLTEAHVNPSHFEKMKVSVALIFF